MLVHVTAVTTELGVPGDVSHSRLVQRRKEVFVKESFVALLRDLGMVDIGNLRYQRAPQRVLGTRRGGRHWRKGKGNKRNGERMMKLTKTEDNCRRGLEKVYALAVWKKE